MLNYKAIVNNTRDVHNIIRNGSYYYEPLSNSINSGLKTLTLKKGHCLEWAFATGLLMEHLNYPLEILAMVYTNNDKKISRNIPKNGIHFINPYQTLEGFFAIGKSRVSELGERIVAYKDIDSLIESYRTSFVNEGLTLVHSFLIMEDDLLDYDWRYSELDMGSFGLTNHLKSIQRENYHSFLRKKSKQ
ncbi:MAG: hypothetical protein WC867_01940 [Candidatus Pacearchaeota archaeon]|jgi:hypothetical protein